MQIIMVFGPLKRKGSVKSVNEYLHTLLAQLMKVVGMLDFAGLRCRCRNHYFNFGAPVQPLSLSPQFSMLQFSLCFT